MSHGIAIVRLHDKDGVEKLRLAVHDITPGAIVYLRGIAQTRMMAQVGRMLRCSVFLQVGGRSDSQQAYLSELANDQTRIQIARNPNRKIKAFFSKVDRSIAEI
ncbi:hypothetical protein RSA46_07070 [Pseudomonas oryzihabitans]|nr:hypothetical protein SB5_05565 [Pseudomonas psychrotolerans]KTT45510.1 hypothetical protein RSA46_07070 [Pseudomonas psychrotolerans]